MDKSLPGQQIYCDYGNMRLIGYDLKPDGVVSDTAWTDPPLLHQKDSEGYPWQEGATKIGESLVKQIEPRINAEHALHVPEFIDAAGKSAATGTKIKLKRKFPCPIIN